MSIKESKLFKELIVLCFNKMGCTKMKFDDFVNLLFKFREYFCEDRHISEVEKINNLTYRNFDIFYDMCIFGKTQQELANEYKLSVARIPQIVSRVKHFFKCFIELDIKYIELKKGEPMP